MKKNAGFSLIELMVVIAIIAVLAAIALPMYRGHVARTRSSEGSAALALVKTRQEAYRSTHFRYAAGLSELPGYSADIVDIGEYYQISITAATQNTFSALAADRQKGIGSMAAGSDVWQIDDASFEAEHTSYGY